MQAWINKVEQTEKGFLGNLIESRLKLEMFFLKFQFGANQIFCEELIGLNRIGSNNNNKSTAASATTTKEYKRLKQTMKLAVTLGIPEY